MADNGQLDPNTLQVLPGFAPYGAATNFLPASTTTLSNLGTPAMAADYANMRAEFPTELGVLTYAEAYRSLAMQEQRWREHEAGGPLAATPGTSNHGFGRAMDFRNNVGTYSSAAHQWFVTNAARFGFTPISSEGWHWEHLSDTVTSRTATTTASTGTTTPVEEDDMFTDEDRANLAKAAATYDQAVAAKEAARDSDKQGKAILALLRDPTVGLAAIPKRVWQLVSTASNLSFSALVNGIFKKVN